MMSDRTNNYKKTSMVYLTVGILLLICWLLPKLFPEYESTIQIFTIGIAVPTLLIVALLFITRLFLKGTKEQVTLESSVQTEVDSLQDTIEEDFFNKLIKINFKYIDKYYLQTQIQANNSFLVSLIASILSFGIIICGIILMYNGKTNPSIIATTAGMLSQFVAAVFFYLYNKTVTQMSQYHHKLVLTQNVSLALKITEGMEGENKISAQLKIIEELTKDINSNIASKG